jgi:K+-sensing histidine kinase KdpD
VPPFFSFTIAQPTEWIALFVFLLIAIITSQLAGAARRRAEEVRLREHRLRILYELMRVSNSTESLDNQLDVIALSTTRVFSSWGVHTCALLLPDKDGTLVVKADAPIRVDALELTPEVLKAAAAVLQRGVMLTPSDASSQSVVHLFPLKVGTRVIAVLYLNVRDGVSWLVGEKALQAETARDSEQIEFFWTFLDQISSLIERALLRTQTFSHNN